MGVQGKGAAAPFPSTPVVGETSGLRSVEKTRNLLWQRE